MHSSFAIWKSYDWQQLRFCHALKRSCWDGELACNVNSCEPLCRKESEVKGWAVLQTQSCHQLGSRQVVPACASLWSPSSHLLCLSFPRWPGERQPWGWPRCPSLTLIPMCSWWVWKVGIAWGAPPWPRAQLSRGRAAPFPSGHRQNSPSPLMLGPCTPWAARPSTGKCCTWDTLIAWL